jgi:hypothetical protein
MHPRQAHLADLAQFLVEKTADDKTAATSLWLYTCPETKQDFYLPKKMVSVRSPYTGKTFSAKPEKVSMGDVGKELKEDAKAEKADKGKGKAKKAADLGLDPEAVAGDFLRTPNHPALGVITARVADVERVRRASAEALAQSHGIGAVDYARPVIRSIEALADEARAVADQLSARTGG